MNSKYLKYKNKYHNHMREMHKAQYYYINQFGGHNIDYDTTPKTYTISEANNIFTINLFENFNGSSNIFTPIGLIYSLSLIHIATTDNTDKQMNQVLKYKYNIDEINTLIQIFNNNIMLINTYFIINDSVNKINNKYLEIIKPLVKILIGTEIDLFVYKINKHIENTTDTMIKNVIEVSDVFQGITIVNVCYFKGSWEKKFDINETVKMKFHKAETKLVSMMHQIEYFNYYENSVIQLVELPYDEKNYTMGILLPKKYLEEEGLEYSINNVPIITESAINEFINNMTYTLIDLYLPKFTHHKKIDLVLTLKKMGMIDVFESPINMIGSSVSNFIQSVTIIVDEIGVEPYVNKKKYKSSNIQFVANHAFLYYIRHLTTGMFLFFGDYQGK